MPTAPADLGLFGPGSVTWRIHDEPILMLGGLRALFLQTLHPRTLAGVLQNSDYRADPWGRLIRTSNFVGTTIFGTTEQAEAVGRRVRALHARLRATDPRTGAEFAVDEPDLLRWVHVTEVESFLSTARRAGLRLRPSEIDGYYAEQRRTAALVGLDPSTVPGTAAEVEAYYAGVRGDLGMSRDAAEVMLFLFVPPMPRAFGLSPARAAYAGIATTAFAMLPGWARRLYGMPGLPGIDGTASLSARALRLAVRAIPRRLYESPVYRDAMNRAREAARAAAHGN